METERVIGYVELTVIVEREQNQFVSYCPEFDTASCGDTVEEAFENLKDATLVYLNALEETGEREWVFKERNIRIEKHVRVPHKPYHLTVPENAFASGCSLPILARV